MVPGLAGWLLLAGLLRPTFANPLEYHEVEGRSLPVVSELNQRLVSQSRLQDSGDFSRLGLAPRLDPGYPRLELTSRLEPGEPRLGLPSPQEIEAIKKVAQILVMLGEQVLPSIIGDFVPTLHTPGPVSTSGLVAPPDDHNDPVNEN